MEKTGVVNGDDMLLYVQVSDETWKAFGSCTSHSINYAAEVKARTVKPAASQLMGSGLWEEKTIVKLSFTGKAEGLTMFDEAEFSFADLLALWKAAKPVKIKAMERKATEGETVNPYIVARILITGVEETRGAKEDSTHSMSFENCGAPETFDTDKLVHGASAGSGDNNG